MKLRFVTDGGRVIDADAVPGETLMQIATAAMVPGIHGDCGGGCSCGTCHMHLPDSCAERIGLLQPRSDMERELIENGSDFCPRRSRLGCQVTMTAEMDGLCIDVPNNQ